MAGRQALHSAPLHYRRCSATPKLAPLVSLKVPAILPIPPILPIPRPVLVLFIFISLFSRSFFFAARPCLSPSPSPLTATGGPDVVPSEDYSHWPPRCAGFPR